MPPIHELGRCPECKTAITETWVLPEYSTPSGRRIYAECPECGHVAHPVPE